MSSSLAGAGAQQERQERRRSIAEILKEGASTLASPPFTAKGVKEFFRIDLNELRKKREQEGNWPFNNRVLYARKGGEEASSGISEGEPIDLATATALKEVVWGSATILPRPEWAKQGVTFHPYDQMFAYGLKTPKNGTHNFLMCLQVHLLKALLFDKRAARGGQHKKVQGMGTVPLLDPVGAKTKHHSSKKSVPIKRNARPTNDRGGKANSNWSQVLRPNDKSQNDMLVVGLADLLFKVSEGHEAIFCLPGGESCFEPSAHYSIDGITEKLRLIRCTTEEDMRTLLKRYSQLLQQEKGIGLISILYSLVLSRTVEKMNADLQDLAGTPLIDPMGDPHLALLMLVLAAKATPYLHNGIMAVDEDEGGDERVGIETRNEFGLLVWERNAETTAAFSLGSRLKTPVLPIWVTRCNGHIGILFNPNKELMRSYHAENRFQLYYYSDVEGKKEERRETILTIDTRNISTGGHDDADNDFDEAPAQPLECAIRTKWDGCEIDWQGIQPYI